MAKTAAKASPSDETEKPPSSVRIAVPRGTGPIGISVAGAEPLRYRETDGVVEVPEAEVELFLLHISGSSVIEPATPAEKEK